MDLTVALLKKYDVFDQCFFYAFDAKVIRYLYTKYDGRITGYPDFLVRNYQPDTCGCYKELGLALNYVRSEIFPVYSEKKQPMHMYCADTEADVRMCQGKGADLITASDTVPLMKVININSFSSFVNLLLFLLTL